MTLKNNRELEVTKEKLRGLEEHYIAKLAKPVDNAIVRQVTLRSLRQTINQLKEEIIRYESREKSKLGTR